MESVRLFRLLYGFSTKSSRFTILSQTMRDIHKGCNLDKLIKERMRKELLAGEAKTNAFERDATSDIGKFSQQPANALKNHSQSLETPEKLTEGTFKSIHNISAASISVSGLNVKKASSTDLNNKFPRDESKLSSIKPLNEQATPSKSASKTMTSEKPTTVPIKKLNRGLAKLKIDVANRATTSAVQGAEAPKIPATSSTPKEEKPMNAQDNQGKSLYQVIIETFIANKPYLHLRGKASIYKNGRFEKEQKSKYANASALAAPEKPAKK